MRYDMGEFDFTYNLPENFEKRVVQYLLDRYNEQLAKSFKRCKYEYQVIDYAYYAGLKGDNWNKKAIEFTLEGKEKDISVLKSAGMVLKDAVERALKPSESGFLVKNISYLCEDISLQDPASPLSNEERLNYDIEIAETVLDDLIKIGKRLCLNPSFNSESSENAINDYFRDMFISKGYEDVKDQSRHGMSESGHGAGEVDILLSKSGEEIALFEAMKLNSVNTNYIYKHINKAILNYNPLGTATFVVGYVNTANFEDFWNGFVECINNYECPLQIKENISQDTIPDAVTRTARMILTRDRFDFPVYFIAFNIRKNGK